MVAQESVEQTWDLRLEDRHMNNLLRGRLTSKKKNERKGGFTLVEVLVVAGILALIAFLVYPAYLGTSRSYELTDVKTSLQQNARLAMKRMMIYLEAGMIVIPYESNEATDGTGNNYGYEGSYPYKIAAYSWNYTSGISDNDKIALYAALPDASM